MLNSVEVCRINIKQFYRKESGVSGKKHRALENMPRVVERSLCSRSITSQKLWGEGWSFNLLGDQMEAEQMRNTWEKATFFTSISDSLGDPAF